MASADEVRLKLSLRLSLLSSSGIASQRLLLIRNSWLLSSWPELVGVMSDADDDEAADEVFSVIELVVVVSVVSIAFAFTLALAAVVGVSCVDEGLSSSSSSELRLSD